MYLTNRFTAICIMAATLCSTAMAQAESSVRDAATPNIVFMMCDDLGYGDIQCLNPDHGKIATPSLNKLASSGMTFTDGHSGSSVCTPTRYGLMTGRYSWRTTLQKGVVQGFKPDLIAENRPTVASFLKSNGYHTGIIGKWHLNFQYVDPDTGRLLEHGNEGSASLPGKKKKGSRARSKKKKKNKGRLAPVGSTIPDGPVHRGFDYFHGFHHARDMRCVIENDKVIEHDDEINMLPRITRKAVEYINARANATDQTPFFLYVPFGSPHTPILPTPQWQGKSGLGNYADFVMQTDASVGEILNALDQNGLTQNTLVIFTSDNGCSKAADIPALAKQGHRVSAQYRGSKADLWDGGHRVPFIVRWPDEVNVKSKCDQTICLTDLFATVADLIGIAPPKGSAEDSVSFLPALRGKPIGSTRAGVVHHSISGHFGYRQGKWKLLLAKASGGWSSPTERQAASGAPIAQLYDMQNDPSETNNLYLTHPEVVERLVKQLELDVSRGRSADGSPSKNDVDHIKLWKSGKH